MTHPDPLSSLLEAVRGLEQALTRMIGTEKAESRERAASTRESPEGPDPGDVLPGEAMLAEGSDRLGRLGQEVRLLHREVGRLGRLVGDLPLGIDAVLERLESIEARLASADSMEGAARAITLVREAMGEESRGGFWSEATERIDRERMRQVVEEGHDAAHDDAERSRGDLIQGAMAVWGVVLGRPESWQMDLARKHADTPLSRRLEIAGALVAAELDRELRKEARQVERARIGDPRGSSLHDKSPPPAEGHRSGDGPCTEDVDADALTTPQGEEA